jgi:hypothetical protein
MAQQLASTITALPRKIPKTAKPKMWPSAFRLLHTKDEIPTDEIRTVLDWYCKTLEEGGDLITNGNPEYIPIAYSGLTFRKKWDQLQAAWSRKTQTQDPDQEEEIDVSRICTGTTTRAELIKRGSW